MKGDMAGGAAVLGAMSALRDLECPTPVEATICAAENMISGTAFRPGDVIRGMNGVTMEILSTDAEGRLVLADGLVDTARRGATELIDLATLTGAAVVALGDGTTALFATDDTLADGLLTSAERTGERMWRMPLIDELERKIEGDVADIKNTGGRAGGAITAALFLKHFSEGLPWAHLDIAGSVAPGKSERDRAERRYRRRRSDLASLSHCRHGMMMPRRAAASAHSSARKMIQALGSVKRMVRIMTMANDDRSCRYPLLVKSIVMIRIPLRV